ncbi:hypothetical protein [Petrachloros mirabilis]
MTRLKSSCLVWSLLVCLVLVNGYMAVPSVAHAATHASHTAGTHSTGLCAWLCAAGQGVESASVPFESRLQVLDSVELQQVDYVQCPFSSLVFPRGPPPPSR